MNQLTKNDDHGSNNNIVSNDGNSKVIISEERSSRRSTQQLVSAEKENVERLDIRLGKVLSVKVHPDADSMYIEEIDVGDVDEVGGVRSGPRTIVSGLRNHVEIENFPKFVLVLCNLKPRKLRGVLSNGMVLCACNEDHSVVEILTPTSDRGEDGLEFQGGEVISIDGYDMTNSDPVLKPKKKYWEKCEPDMKSNDDGDASYKGTKLLVRGNAFRAKSLTEYLVG